MVMQGKSKMWNLWHGCHKYSVGCQHCYVYRGDAKRNIDSTIVTKTKNFDLPVQKKRNGEYKIPAGTLLYTCFTSDLSAYDIGSWVEQVVAGGESGYEARPCHFEWIMEIRDVCLKNKVSFWFKQTGEKFVKDGKLYHIGRQFQHSQARKAGININPPLPPSRHCETTCWRSNPDNQLSILN
jgi:protein gp37